MNIREVEKVIITGLEAYLSLENRPCKAILANVNTPSPKYPYVAYTPTQAVVENNGTYGIREDGTRIKAFDSTFSFTVQSDDEDESVFLAVRARKWFDAVGVVYLSDNGISVKRVGSVLNRDTMLTIEYEYRNGFDVTFTLLEEIDASEFNEYGYIEQATIRNDS